MNARSAFYGRAPCAGEGFDRCIAGLPKAELHVPIEGAAELEPMLLPARHCRSRGCGQCPPRTSRVILCFPRHRPEDDALATLAEAGPWLAHQGSGPRFRRVGELTIQCRLPREAVDRHLAGIAAY